MAVGRISWGCECQNHPKW